MKIPDWFDIDRYKYPSLDDESQVKEAALAVLDRVTFFQTVTHHGFDPADVDATAAKEALEALRHWSAEPYRRPDGHILEKLRAALQPVPESAIHFEGVLAREEKEAQEAEEQKAQGEAAKWCRIWEEVCHLPPNERWQAAIDLACQGGEPTAPDWVEELLTPVGPSRVGKLLRYRIAVYLDWALYLALAGELATPPTMVRMHHRLWDGEKDGRDWRTVGGFLEELKGAGHLGLRVRIEQGGVSDAWVRSVKRHN